MKYNTLNSIFNYLNISTLFIVPNQFPLSILHPLNLYTIDINYNILQKRKLDSWQKLFLRPVFR